MDLHDGKRHGLDRIVETHTVLGQRRGVEEATLYRVDAFMQRVQQDAFVVGLHDLEIDAELTGQRAQALVDILQRQRAVDVRLTPPEKVEIRAVQDQDPEPIVNYQHLQ